MTARIIPTYLRLVRPDHDPLDLRYAQTPRVRPRPTLYAADVIAAVVRRTKVNPVRLVSNDRGRGPTYARHLCWYLLRDVYALMTVSAIAATFSRDHHTVIDGARRIKIEQRTRRATEADVDAIRRALARKARHDR